MYNNFFEISHLAKNPKISFAKFFFNAIPRETDHGGNLRRAWRMCNAGIQGEIGGLFSRMEGFAILASLIQNEDFGRRKI